MSLLTVMAGAAIAPALGLIKQHFAYRPAILVQLIVSMPALFIIVTNFFFSTVASHLSSRTIAISGLLLYVVAGAGCYFCADIYALMIMRGLLGVSVGLIMPLSTGLLAFYYPPERQAQLMGFSAAMNQMGGVVATLLAGLLAQVEWNYAFLVYLLGLIALVMVIIWLPDARLSTEGKTIKLSNLVRFHPSVTGMFLLMTIFFVYPTNFAITAPRQCEISTTSTTVIMVGLDLVAFLVGMAFGGIMNACRRQLKYFAPLMFIAGYSCLAWADGLSLIIAGSALIGISAGLGVPYLNTIASIKGGRDSVNTVMPLLSAALYLGQFVSPLLVMPLSGVLFDKADIAAPYKVAVALSVMFLAQVWLTRNLQSLPPEQHQ